MQQKSEFGVLNPEPIEKEPGVYVGQGETKAGETVYCFIVKQEDHAEFWEHYCKQTRNATSVFQHLIKEIKPSIHEGTVHYSYEIEGRSAAASSALACQRFNFSSPETFNTYVQELGERMFTFVPGHHDVLPKLNKSKLKTLVSIVGSVGEITHRDYICYLSKSAHFTLNQPPAPVSRFSLETYIREYSDLLMCVGLNFQTEFGDDSEVYPDAYSREHVETFDVRGIFRNPSSIIEGTYRDISMIMHGFMGAVVQKYYPHKREERVAPMLGMLSLMCRHLPESDIKLKPQEECYEGEYSYEALKHLDMAQYGARGGSDDNTVYIKIEALSKCYYEANQQHYKKEEVTKSEHGLAQKFNSANSFKRELDSTKEPITEKDDRFRPN